MSDEYKQNNENNENNESNESNENSYSFHESEQTPAPRYEAADYSRYYQYEDQNWRDAQASDWTQSAELGQTSSVEKPKKEKKHGFGLTLIKTAAVAAVFGLVAGSVFQGVGMVAERFRGKENTEIQAPVTTTTTTTVGSSKQEDTDITKLIKNTMPSMVSITSTVTTNYSYFGQQFSEDEEGSGSGIIVGMNNKELLVATNNHVIDDAKAIQVSFIDNEVVEADIKGTDSTADLAVLSVPLENIKESTLQSIKVATLGDSNNVQMGERVVAIGNALGYGQSSTVGYISATNREVSVSSKKSSNTMTLLQTDAAINPGNSGGALLNMNGEVIGINSVKYSDTSVEGMGYAIPISFATPIINEIMNYEKLNEDEKGYLGISGTPITEENNLYNMPNGIYVSELAKDGAAEKGGMQKGDIITEINGTAVTTMEAVQQKVNNTRVGTEITVTVMRNENGEYVEKELKVVLQGKDSLNTLATDNNANNNANANGQQIAPNDGQEDYDEDSPFGNGIFDDFFRRFGY